MNKNQFVIILLLSLFFSGCKLKNSKINIEQDKAFAEKCLQALRKGDFNTFISNLDLRVTEQGINQNLSITSQLLLQKELVSQELISWSFLYRPDRHRSQLNYQYQFKDSWAIVNIAIETVGQTKKIVLLNVSPIPASLQTTNAFSLAGKSPVHYVILLAAIVIPVFIVTVLIVCIRTKLQKQKWLWIIFTLFGVGNIAFNWTTGQLRFNPVYILFFGSGYIKASQYAPAIINISLPIGAIIFLFKRKSIKVIEPVTTENVITQSNASANTSEISL